MKIKIIDSIHCELDKEALAKVKPFLSYKGKYGKPTKYRTKIVQYDKTILDKNLLLTGLLPKVIRQFPNIVIDGELEKLKPISKPHLKGIKPRPDQKRLVDEAIRLQRGVLLSPTGSGKTIVAMLLLSCFPEDTILFLCHNLSIIAQTKKEMEKFGFEDIQVLGGGNNEFDDSKRITLATIQTFAGLDPDDYSWFFDITVIDEAHHVRSKKGLYAKVMGVNQSPMKIGLTATLPPDTEGLLSLEGYIGPVIGEVTVQEGVEKNILAKPKIKLIPVPYSNSVGEFFKYHQIYQYGIVENRSRNRLILEEAKNQIDADKTVLIMVKEIAHGDNIVDMAKSLFKMDVIFVQGKTEGETRDLIQNTLDKKLIKCVVCTAVWREGINVKSLNTIILALGGKSAIQTAQALGRGLRVDPESNKISVLLIDMLDPFKYLAQHSVARISLYIKNGWL